MKTYVTIATYNEKDNIEKLILKIFGLDIEDLSVITIDDNSPDGTAKIVERLQTQLPKLHLIKRTKKLGYGSAHLEGFSYALQHKADIVVSMDADFSHDPLKIIQLIKAVQSGADVAVGSRKIAGGKIIGWNQWRKFCSAGAMITSKLLLGIKTNDLTSGFRAYNRKVLTTINLNEIKSNGYSFLEELIYKIEKHGFVVREIPIIFRDRQLGQSKLSKKEIAKFFITIFQIKLSSKK